MVRGSRLRALVVTGLTCGVVATGIIAPWEPAGAAEQATATCPAVSPSGVVTPAPKPGADWSGCVIEHADLSAKNLTGVNLADAFLFGDDFSGANLTKADFLDAAVEQVKLAGVNISGANLNAGNMDGVTSGGVIASSATVLPPDFKLVHGYLMGPGVSLAGVDLTGLDLSGVDLQNVTLTGANVARTALGKANLTRVSTGGLTGVPASLPPRMFITKGYLVGPTVNLHGAALSGFTLASADLAGADLSVANLSDADLAKADLAGAYSVDADLSGADLSGANLTGSDASGAILAAANLSNAIASKADFESAVLATANLGGMDLSAANLDNAQSGIVSGTPAALPPHWKIIQGYLLGPTVNLSSQAASFTGVNFSGADLENADVDGVDFSSATLIGTDFRGTQFASTDFQGADLTSADLSKTSLDANLSNANLSNASLASAQMSLAELSGANLAGANLTGIIAGGPVTGTPAALPPHFFFAYGFIFGPSVIIDGGDLQGANLSGEDLSKVTVKHANLTQADLDHANLTSASLAGDIVTGATFDGATWLHTVCPDNSNSDKHVAGCLSALDTTPPAVAVTGVGSGKVYVTGAVPKAGCKTTDNGTVYLPATVKVTTTGKNGAGRFTATCAGAVDLAGNKQKAAVSVSYTVGYGLHGFIAPAAGAAIVRSSHVFTVRFRLTSASGNPVSGSLAKALAAAKGVRVTLRGPGISAVTVNCGWNAAQQDLACVIGIPSGVLAGSAQRYTITAAENVGTGFLAVPAVGGTANPEVVHFR
jgi:uncharacterized protein YjbI with pentapeptide repeats